jgi:hypothetical protein
MASTTRDEHPVVAPVRQRQATAPTSTGGAGLFTLLWLIFLGVLIFEPERLDAVWSWFRDLPMIAQVVGWVVMLPLVLGLWIWQAPWAAWIRVSLIVLLALSNVITFSRPRRPRTR